METERVWCKLLYIMGLKATDTIKVLWTFSLAFISGALLCYISSLPIALFLMNYGSEQLPFIYLAVAFLYTVFGFAYAFFERRFIFQRLIIGLAFIICFVLTLLGTALITLNSKIIIIFMLLWVILSYDLIEFCVWSVINNIYSIQQAKKSFGIIGSCQSLGGLTAGLTSPFLISLMGVHNLIACVAVLSLFLVFAMFFLLRQADNLQPDEEENATDNTPSFQTIKNNKYIIKIASLTALAIFAMYSVDLLFNFVAEDRYPDGEKLAGFLGVFFGLVDGVDLLCSMALYSWLLKRMGVVSTLFILPVVGFLISLPIALLSFIPLWVNGVFWLIVTLKLWEESVRTSLTEMSHLLLLQPFPLQMRSFVQSKLDSIVIGLSMAIISIVLILLGNTLGHSILALSLCGMLFFVLSISILLSLKVDYRRAVSAAIVGGELVRDNPVPRGVRYAAEFKKHTNIPQILLEKLLYNFYFEMQSKGIQLLRHANEEVSQSFIQRCMRQKNRSLRYTALKMLSSFKAPYTPDFLKDLYQFIIDESQYIQIQHQYILLLPNDDDTRLLVNVLNLKRKRAIEHLMQAMVLYYDPKVIRKVQEGVMSLSEEERGYALELLDIVLEKNHKKNILPLFIDIYLTEHNNAVTFQSVALYQMLKNNLIYVEHDEMSALTCVASIYIVVKKSIDECIKEVRDLKTVKNSLIQETLEWLKIT